MNVLHVHSGNLFGGVETLLLTLSQHEHVSPSVKHHYALCFEGRFSKEVAAAGALVYFLGNVRLSRPFGVRRVRQSLKVFLAKNDFDLVVSHSSWTRAIFGKPMQQSGLPLVSWFHGNPVKAHWSDRWARVSPPDLAICNSQFTASIFSKTYPRVPYEVIYCPVSFPEGSYSETDRMQVRAELKTSSEATVIIQVSRMEAGKGHDIHLRALALLQSMPQWICWFVGGDQRPSDKRYLDELKEKARSLGIESRVRFLGERADVLTLLKAADIYCQPNSYPETFGITFVEALHARKPVITTSIGGAREIVDVSCGFLVPPNDAPAVAAALKRLIEDVPLQHKLGNAGPKRAETLCNVEAQISRIEDCFFRLSDDYCKKSSASHCPTQGA